MASVRILTTSGEQASTASEAVQPFLLADTGSSEGGTITPDRFGSNVLVYQHADGMRVMPIVHPDRQRPKFNFAKAWRHFKILIKDKEQTDQVVAVLDALPWRGVGEAASAFLATERGRAIFQAEPYLPDFLDDYDALRRMPKGSVAQAYCDFMQREGLTAAGIVDSTITRQHSQALNDGVAWYIDRLRDIHDLIHILTGYGRDIFSEQCVQAYTYGQRPGPGHIALAWAGTLLMKVKLRSRAPILRGLNEAVRNGKLCSRLAEQSIHELFAMPLEVAREKLNVPEAYWYHKVFEVWQSEGVNPHAFMAKKPG